MSSAPVTPLNEAVRITVPQLVRLNRMATALPLRPGQILARQSGDYQSAFKGRGMEFDESRLYQPGDDIRNIDWRVTARTGKPHTKLFREERERPVFVWVDYRAPMFFATRGRYKSVLAAQFAGLLGWSAIRHGDRLGSVIFSEAVHHELKPQRSKAAVLRLINQMVHHPAWEMGGAGGDPGAGYKALLRLRRVARPGSLLFLISDFRNLDEIALSQITRLGRHNDVVLIFIYDPLETELPAAGHYRISNGSEELLVDTYDRERVSSYRQRFGEHRQRLEQIARMERIHLLSCSTQGDPLAVLRAGLQSG